VALRGRFTTVRSTVNQIECVEPLLKARGRKSTAQIENTAIGRTGRLRIARGTGA
jgi:hypothetical protein